MTIDKVKLIIMANEREKPNSVVPLVKTKFHLKTEEECATYDKHVAEDQSPSFKLSDDGSCQNFAYYIIQVILLHTNLTKIWWFKITMCSHSSLFCVLKFIWVVLRWG